MGKRDDKKAEQEFEQMMKAAKEGRPIKRVDVNDGRNYVHTNRGLVISADVIEGGINFQA